MSSNTKLKLTDRGWTVVGWLGGIAFLGIVILTTYMEANL